MCLGRTYRKDGDQVKVTQIRIEVENWFNNKSTFAPFYCQIFERN